MCYVRLTSVAELVAIFSLQDEVASPRDPPLAGGDEDSFSGIVSLAL